MLQNHIKGHKTSATKYFNNKNSLQYHAIIGRMWDPILLIVTNVITITGSNSVGTPVKLFIACSRCIIRRDLEYWIVRCN